MVDGVKNLFGLRYVLATVKAAPAAPKVTSSSQKYTSTQFTQTGKVDPKVANKLAAQVTSQKAEGTTSGAIGVNKNEYKNSLAINYQLSDLSGKSDKTKDLQAQYTTLKDGNNFGQINYLDSKGNKSSFQISADSIKMSDGRTFSLAGDSISKALKNNQIDIDGTIDVQISKVQGYTYTDAAGAAQVQPDFSIVSYKYTDGAGHVQDGEFAVTNNSDPSKYTDISQQTAENKVTSKYSVSNTTDRVEETQNPDSFTIQIMNSFDVAARYRQAHDNADYLIAVNSTQINTQA